MKDCSQTDKTSATRVEETRDKTLVSEAEAAAAKDEPMGSIAAAVPGDDEAAENGLEPGQDPGSEEPTVREEAGPTAGTEFPAAPKGSKENQNAA